MAQGVLERRCLHGLVAGQRQVAHRLLGVGGAPRLVEVVGQVGGVLLQGAGVEPLHRLGYPQVPPLPPGQGEAADQRLADKLVGEGEAGLRAVGGGGDEVGPLRLVDGVEEGVGAPRRPAPPAARS